MDDLKIRVLTRPGGIFLGHDVAIKIGRHRMIPSARTNYLDLVEGQEIDPTFTGEQGEEFLRAALNAAWEIGLRPDGYLDVRENMKATDAHLQDMRALAFGKLNIDAPRKG